MGNFGSRDPPNHRPGALHKELKYELATSVNYIYYNITYIV